MVLSIKELRFSFLFFTAVFFSTYSFRELGVDIAPYSRYGLLILIFVFLYFIIKLASQNKISIIHNSKIKTHLIYLTLLPSFVTFFWSEFNLGGLRWTILHFIMLISATGIISSSNMFPLKLSFNVLFKSISITSLILAVVAFLSLFTAIIFGPINIPQAEGLRTSGWLSSANFFVNIIGVGIFTSFLLLIRKQGLVYFFFVILLLIAMVLSGSRGGLVSFIGASMFYIFITQKISFSRRLFSNIWVFLLSFIIFIIGIYFLLDRINFEVWDLRYFALDQSFEEDYRFVIWERILSKWAKGSPVELLFGFGRGAVTEFSSTASHNSFIDMLVEYGIFYLCSFLIVFLLFVKRTWQIFRKTKDKTIAITLTIIIFLFLRSFTIYSLIGINYETFIFYLLVMVLNSLILLYSKSNTSIQQSS